MFAVDLDGVLADSLTQATRLVCEALGIAPTSLAEHRAYDDLALAYPEELREQAAALYRQVYDGNLAYAAAMPLPNARSTVTRLARMGLLSGYITRRPADSHEVSQRWLKTHGFPDAPVLTISRKGSKGEAMVELGASVLIEDSLSEARAVRSEGFGAVLIKQPYNAEGIELLSGSWDAWEAMFFRLELHLASRHG